MAERETVVVEGTECYLFPIPLSIKDDPLKDAQFFLNCAYARLFALNQDEGHRSRELSLAITNVQQGQLWLGVHVDRRHHGIPDEPIMVTPKEVQDAR